MFNYKVYLLYRLSANISLIGPLQMFLVEEFERGYTQQVDGCH